VTAIDGQRSLFGVVLFIQLQLETNVFRHRHVCQHGVIFNTFVLLKCHCEMYDSALFCTTVLFSCQWSIRHCCSPLSLRGHSCECQNKRGADAEASTPPYGCCGVCISYAPQITNQLYYGPSPFDLALSRTVLLVLLERINQVRANKTLVNSA